MRGGDGRSPEGFALRPVLLVVAAKSALNLAFAGRYGWQRDELYYAVAGRHLQGGYVEFPPVTALLSQPGFALAVTVAAVLLVPNLVWQATHGWVSVHWFLHPAASATDESRP